MYQYILHFQHLLGFAVRILLVVIHKVSTFNYVCVGMGANVFQFQSYGVKGMLRCGDKAAANVLVKIYDEDTG